MLVDICIVSAVLLVGLYYLTIAILGLFPKFRATAVGTLSKAKTYKHVPKRHGGTIPHLTKYVYLYTVNGKVYRHKGEGRYSKRRLHPKGQIVYVKGFPRHAYLNKFRGEKEWIWGVTLLICGLMLLVVLFRNFSEGYYNI